jgi:hypothetical protein
MFCGGRYQPGCTGILWPAEGTSQAVTIFKKWKNPSSALRRTRTRVQALFWYLVATNVPFTYVATWTEDDGWDEIHYFVSMPSDYTLYVGVAIPVSVYENNFHFM